MCGWMEEKKERKMRGRENDLIIAQLSHTKQNPKS
jgi:hypothetical protein